MRCSAGSTFLPLSAAAQSVATCSRRTSISSGRSEPGNGGGALTGHKAESLGLMLNGPRFPERAAADALFTPARALSRWAESLSAAWLWVSRLSSRVTVSLAAESMDAARGIRMGRGDQSAGFTSQSCLGSSCCCTARAEALPQPSSTAVRNAIMMVERKVDVAGEERSISPDSREMLSTVGLPHRPARPGPSHTSASIPIAVGNIQCHAVPRNNCLREHRLGLGQELGGVPVVSRADMGENQPAGPGLDRYPGGLSSGRVAGLLCPFLFVAAKGGLVDQQVGSAGGLDHREVGTSVPGIDQRPPSAGRANQVARGDGSAIR